MSSCFSVHIQHVFSTKPLLASESLSWRWLPCQLIFTSFWVTSAMEQVHILIIPSVDTLCCITLIYQSGMFVILIAGHIDDIYPYFMRHAKQIFPMLDCMDDLRKISDLRLPANWYLCCSAVQLLLFRDLHSICLLQNLYLGACGFARYPEARAIQRKVIFHAGPTNSGKTYHAIQRYLAAKSGVYCGPLKLLAHEIFEKSNTVVGLGFHPNL